MEFLKLFLVVFFPLVSFPAAGRRIRRFLWVAGLLGVVGLLHARTLLRVASTFLLLVRVLLDGARTILAVLCFENSVVDGVASNVLGDANIVVAAARRGENVSGSHSLTFQNLVFERFAESVCMDSFAVNSHNSVTCHPFMHAPSFARAFVGGSWWIGVFDGGMGVSGTARMDESLHDGIHSVSACSNSSFKGFSEYHGSPCARWNAFPNSRSERGHAFKKGYFVQG